MPPFADLLALIEDGPDNAVLRSLHRRFLDVDRAAVRLGAARIPEHAGLGPPAQPADGLAAHADMLGRGGDAAAVGELLDEGDLPLGSPAIVAGTKGDRLEICGDFGGCFHSASSEKGGEAVISCRGL